MLFVRWNAPHQVQPPPGGWVTSLFSNTIARSLIYARFLGVEKRSCRKYRSFLQSHSGPCSLPGHRQTAAKQRRVNWMVPGSWSPVSNSPKVHEISRSFREGTSFLLLTIRRKGSYFIQAVEHTF